jgi:hypothetical protein
MAVMEFKNIIKDNFSLYTYCCCIILFWRFGLVLQYGISSLPLSPTGNEKWVRYNILTFILMYYYDWWSLA